MERKHFVGFPKLEGWLPSSRSIGGDVSWRVVWVFAFIALAPLFAARAQPTPCRRPAPGYRSIVFSNKAFADSALSLRDANLIRQLQASHFSRRSAGLARLLTDTRQSPAWKGVDLALEMLALGVSAPLHVSLDSLESRPSSNRIHFTVSCETEKGLVPLGTYYLLRSSDSSAAPSQQAVAAFDLLVDSSRQIVLNQHRLFLVPGAVFNRDSALADLRFADNLRQTFSRPALPPMDLVLLAAGDTTLSALGIDRWAEPISEFTMSIGPLVVSRSRAHGGLSRHELVHAALLDVPQHWLLREGIPTYVAGARELSFSALFCKHATSLRSWIEQELFGVLSGEVTRDASDIEMALVGATLARLVLDLPTSTWTLTNRAEHAMLSKSWRSSIQELASKCA